MERRREVGRRNNGKKEGKVDLKIQKRWMDRREEENDQGKEEEVKKRKDGSWHGKKGAGMEEARR